MCTNASLTQKSLWISPKALEYCGGDPPRRTSSTLPCAAAYQYHRRCWAYPPRRIGMGKGGTETFCVLCLKSCLWNFAPFNAKKPLDFPKGFRIMWRRFTTADKFYSPVRRGVPVPSALQGLSAAADRDGKRWNPNILRLVS